jgi:tetrahydromethanopterin S-methyltransferase subunit C
MLPPAAKVVSEGFIEIVFFLLGIGILLPWNAYISTKQYFVLRICEQDPILAPHIELYFPILYSGASVVSLAVVILVQPTRRGHHTVMRTHGTWLWYLWECT